MTTIALVLAAVLLASVLARLAFIAAIRRKGPRVAGAELAASSEDPAGLPEPEDRFEVVPGSDEKVLWGCGHTAWARFHMNFWGLPMSPSEEALAERKTCPDCMLERVRRTSIRCVRCGHIIMPGDPVACYGGGRGLRKRIATRTPRGDWIGCLRWDCCPSGGFFAGHWDGEKFVGAYGGRTVVEEAFATGKPVIVSDTEKKK